MAIDRLEDMLGKRLLVGIRYVDNRGEVVSQVGFCGQVVAVDPLVSIERGSPEKPFTLPPETDAYDVAGPGEHRLHASSEVVIDPDFLTTWTVHAPPRWRRIVGRLSRRGHAA